jgi:hypothetical protein
MPLIHITAPQGALKKNDQKTLVSRLSYSVLKSEGANPQDPAAQSLVWSYYTEREIDQVYVGGKILEQPPLIIAVTTPEGALTPKSRRSRRYI